MYIRCERLVLVDFAIMFAQVDSWLDYEHALAILRSMASLAFGQSLFAAQMSKYLNLHRNTARANIIQAPLSHTHSQY